MRNDTATSYAGKLLHDLSPDLWESAGWISLKDWNSTHAKPPLLESELRAVFESIGQKEKETGAQARLGVQIHPDRLRPGLQVRQTDQPHNKDQTQEKNREKSPDHISRSKLRQNTSHIL